MSNSSPKGAKLLLPVAVEGALFSVGDGHFAQGDGEVCVTAVEMGATAAVRFRVLKNAPPSVPCGRRDLPTTATLRHPNGPRPGVSWRRWACRSATTA